MLTYLRWQFEFVRQLSAQPQSTVFALVRTKANSQKLFELNAKNVHVLEADITDVKALKVIFNVHTV